MISEMELTPLTTTWMPMSMQAAIYTRLMKIGPKDGSRFVKSLLQQSYHRLNSTEPVLYTIAS